MCIGVNIVYKYEGYMNYLLGYMLSKITYSYVYI